MPQVMSGQGIHQKTHPDEICVNITQTMVMWALDGDEVYSAAYEKQIGTQRSGFEADRRAGTYISLRTERNV